MMGVVTVEIPLREKYLWHQVKKISAPKGSGGGSAAKKKHSYLPSGKNAKVLTKTAAPARVRVMVLTASGRRAWTWQ
jgi:hypothetical protein